MNRALKPKGKGRIFLISAILLLSSFAAVQGAETVASDAGERDYQIKLEEHELAKRQYWLTFAGLVGTATALVFGYIQWSKADKWKRAEFVANEMKIFFDDPNVCNALLMIDWAPRRINLFHSEDPDISKYPKVTRVIQVSALRPHTLLRTNTESDSEGQAPPGELSLCGGQGHFTVEEARIRDTYDRFLDYLERFASYIQSRLISKEELDPYLRYWIDDIAGFTSDAEEAAWTCALMAYVEFYGFVNVQRLFELYGHDFTTAGTLFRRLGAAMKDQSLPTRLREACMRQISN